jgi:hypothetical protein
LNAALAVLAAGLEVDLMSALDRCSTALDAGHARRVLARWVSATRKGVAA